MSDLIFTTQSSFLHHGIQGQKWGVQNGPPYPLDRKARRAERKALKEEKKANKKIDKLNRKAAEYAAKTRAKNEKVSYKRVQNELAKQKATYRDLKRNEWTKDIYTGETQKERRARIERDREFTLRAQQQMYQQKQNQPTLKDTMKRVLIETGGVLLKDAAGSIGKDIIERNITNPYLEKNKSSSKKEYESNEQRNKKEKQEADYWESKSRIEKAKWQMEHPNVAYGKQKKEDEDEDDKDKEDKK